MRAFALLLTTALVAALLAPAATADPTIPTQCAEQDMGPATLTACTPAVPECLALSFGDGGLVSLCFHEHETPTDLDGDGYAAEDGDCDDQDPSVYPGAAEAPNGIDDDCDGLVDEDFADMDGDGFTMAQGDCDDNDSGVNPTRGEVNDRRDNDCDGVADEGFQDSGDWDADGVTLDGGDCHDGDANTFPGATEIADRRDNDCNGVAEA